MTYSQALAIANDFIKTIDETETRVWENNTALDDMSIDMSVVWDDEDNMFNTYIELIDKATDTMIDCMTAYGIDSPQNIADALLDLCKGD